MEQPKKRKQSIGLKVCQSTGLHSCHEFTISEVLYVAQVRFDTFSETSNKTIDIKGFYSKKLFFDLDQDLYVFILV